MSRLAAIRGWRCVLAHVRAEVRDQHAPARGSTRSLAHDFVGSPRRAVARRDRTARRGSSRARRCPSRPSAPRQAGLRGPQRRDRMAVDLRGVRVPPRRAARPACSGSPRSRSGTSRTRSLSTRAWALSAGWRARSSPPRTCCCKGTRNRRAASCSRARPDAGSALWPKASRFDGRSGVRSPRRHGASRRDPGVLVAGPADVQQCLKLVGLDDRLVLVDDAGSPRAERTGGAPPCVWRQLRGHQQ